MNDDEKDKEILLLKNVLVQHALIKSGRIIPSAAADVADIVVKGGTVQDDGSITYSTSAGVLISPSGEISLAQGTSLDLEIELILEKKSFYANAEPKAGKTKNTTGYTKEELMKLRNPHQLLAIANNDYKLK